MKRIESLPELLSPAGDFDCLVAAVRGGADAVYLGAKSFGARAFAKNFELDELRRAVAYCHLHGVKLYVTLNTLLLDSEIPVATELAEQLYNMGVDALIVADLGLVSAVRRRVPNMELHASTQMSVHNSLGADEAYALGCTRVVLAREVCASDMKAITEKCKPEVEVFLHGALCVCHSGQCLFSSLVGGRSGNRGECAQPCRLPYSNGYALSLTDLSLAGHIPSLIEAGVSSLKIEGRMKSPDYVYTVTSIYRRLLDERRTATRSESERLARAFSRGGFTDGYYTGRLDKKNMLGIRSDDDKRATKEEREALAYGLSTPTRVRISASAALRLGEPAALTLTLPSGKGRFERRVTVTGDIPSAAISRPLTAEDIKARLCKMGNTLFELSPEDIELTLDEGINLSPAAINSLRRAAADALTETLNTPKASALKVSPCSNRDEKTTVPNHEKMGDNGKGMTSAICEAIDDEGENTTAYIDEAIAEKDVKQDTPTDLSAKNGKNEEAKANAGRAENIRNTAIFHDPALYNSVGTLDGLVELAFIPIWRMSEATRSGFGIMLPPVIMEGELEEIRALCATARSTGVEYALVGNLGHLCLCREFDLAPICDFRFNVMNSYTGAVLSSLGVNNCLLSPELTAPQARSIGGSVVGYGRIPLMLTERCFMSDCFGCGSCSACSLTDRKGVAFPMIREYKHRTLILNSAVTYMGDRRGELRGVYGTHFIFTIETECEAKQISRAYKNGERMPLPIPFRRMGRRTVKD